MSSVRLSMAAPMYRAGTRFGPAAIRRGDYLGFDGSRPHLALRTDGLRDLRVVDAGDVEMPPGYIERSLQNLEEAVTRIASAGAIPLATPYFYPWISMWSIPGWHPAPALQSPAG